MRGHFFTILAAFALLTTPAQADGERAGVFDYYVMALSWSPNWCATEGDAKGSEQCDSRHDYGWTLHGLWPQFRQGWPSYCRTTEAPPTRRQTSRTKTAISGRRPKNAHCHRPGSANSAPNPGPIMVAVPQIVDTTPRTRARR